MSKAEHPNFRRPFFLDVYRSLFGLILNSTTALVWSRFTWLCNCDSCISFILAVRSVNDCQNAIWDNDKLSPSTIDGEKRSLKRFWLQKSFSRFFDRVKAARLDINWQEREKIVFLFFSAKWFGNKLPNDCKYSRAPKSKCLDFRCSTKLGHYGYKVIFIYKMV